MRRQRPCRGTPAGRRTASLSDARVLRFDAADSHEPTTFTSSDQVDLARFQLFDRVTEGLSWRVATESQLGAQPVQQGDDLRVTGRHHINLGGGNRFSHGRDSKRKGEPSVGTGSLTGHRSAILRLTLQFSVPARFSTRARSDLDSEVAKFATIPFQPGVLVPRQFVSSAERSGVCGVIAFGPQKLPTENDPLMNAELVVSGAWPPRRWRQP